MENPDKVFGTASYFCMPSRSARSPTSATSVSPFSFQFTLLEPSTSFARVFGSTTRILKRIIVSNYRTKARNISRCNSSYYAIHHHYATRSSAFFTVRKKSKRKKERRNVIATTVNTESNEYFKVTHKMKITHFDRDCVCIRSNFIVRNFYFYTKRTFNEI